MDELEINGHSIASDTHPQTPFYFVVRLATGIKRCHRFPTIEQAIEAAKDNRDEDFGAFLQRYRAHGGKPPEYVYSAMVN